MADFVLDYYEMEFNDFKEKFECLLGCKLNESGYIVGKDKLMSIRDLSYFANKEKKFAKEVSEGRERGTWVNTTHQDVEITTSQTGVGTDIINLLNMIKIEMQRDFKRIHVTKNSKQKQITWKLLKKSYYSIIRCSLVKTTR